MKNFGNSIWSEDFGDFEKIDSNYVVEHERREKINESERTNQSTTISEYFDSLHSVPPQTSMTLDGFKLNEQPLTLKPISFASNAQDIHFERANEEPDENNDHFDHLGASNKKTDEAESENFSFGNYIHPHDNDQKHLYTGEDNDFGNFESTSEDDDFGNFESGT